MNTEFEPVFQKLLDDPKGSLTSIRDDPVAFEKTAMGEEQGLLRTDAAIPSLSSISAIVFDGFANVVERFGPDWIPAVSNFAELEERAVMPPHKRWPEESGQWDKWTFCLTAAIIAAYQEVVDDEANTPEPHAGI